jgi:putative ABC transport system permease protein
VTLTNLLRHISLKRVRLQKAQTFMALAGICLGVAAVVSIGIINKSVLQSFEDQMNRVTGRAVLQITSAQSGFPEAMLERVQKVDGVEYAVPVIDTHGFLQGAKESSLMVLGVDVLQDGQIRDYSLSDESADIPDPLLFLAKPDSILITREMAKREGIKLDQVIRIETVSGVRPFRVRGLLDPEGPAKAMAGSIAIMDIYAAQMAFGMEGRIDRIDLSLLRGMDLETVKKRIEAALPEGYRVDTPEGRTRQIEILLSSFQRNIDLVSYIAVFVGMYLIYNAVSISVVHRRKEIGVLRALGTTRGQIVRLFLGETVVLAVVGSALGVAFGVFLAKSLVGVFGQIVSEMFMRTSVSGISINWISLFMGFLSGIVTSLVAAIFPALSSARITPISAIRSMPFSEEGMLTGKRLIIGSVLFIALSAAILALYELPGSARFHSVNVIFLSMLSLLVGVSLATPFALRLFLNAYHRLLAPRLGSVGRLAGLNLLKNITRNSVAAAAIFYGIAVFVSTSSFMYSTKQSVLGYLDNVVKAEILVTSGHPLATTGSQNIPMPLELMDEIGRMPGVLAVDPFRKVYIDYQGKRALLIVLHVEHRTSYTKFSVVRGDEQSLRKQLPNQNAVAVNESLAAQYGLKPGDRITLPTPAGPVSFTVAAVIVEYSSDSGTLLMDIGTYQKYWGERLVDTIAVRVKPGEDVTAVRDAIQKKFGSDRKLFVLASWEFKREVRKMLDQVFIFDHMLNIITLTIASLGIIITLLASVLERTREIGILRSIGMLKKQVSRIVVLESMLLGVVGGVLGCVAGLILGWMTLEGFYRADYGGSAEFFIPWVSIAWALVMSTGLSALAGVYPARKAAKTNIVEALAYE